MLNSYLSSNDTKRFASYQSKKEIHKKICHGGVIEEIRSIIFVEFLCEMWKLMI